MGTRGERTVITFASLVLGALPLAGGLLRFAGWLGLGWSGAAMALPVVGPVLSLFFKVAENALDLLFMALRALVRLAIKGADHISKSVPATVLALGIIFGAWKFGPGDWRFWGGGNDLMAASSASASEASAPAKRRATRVSAPRKRVSPAAGVSETIRNALSRNF